MKKVLTQDLIQYYTYNFPNKIKVKNIFDYIVLGIGGNLGDVKSRFNKLLLMLKKNRQIKVISTSILLKNPPFGFVDQDDFYNGVIVLDTNLSPNELLKLTQKLENRFYRKNEFKNAPRTLDLDIIIYKNKKINQKHLIVPHPQYKKRQSVMIPLSEITNIKKSPIKQTKELKPKVLVGLSGGIDSSISAMLLQKMGYEVEGVYMKLHSIDEDYHKNNLEAIAKVSNYLGIKYHILDIEKLFEKEVYNYFVTSYKDGITPNPCVVCNRLIKFGAMADFAKSLGINRLATGHYAKTDGKYIYSADDKSKDQSYFLAQINKDVIPMLIFPLSEYKKEDIIALGKTIPNFKNIAQKKESQEICFVPTVYTDILSKHINVDKEGDVIKDGKIVGKHKGYMHYTIGKRRGFSVHGAHDPHFVLKTNPKDNTIEVGTRDRLAVKNVVLSRLNMFIEDKEFEATIKLRYRNEGYKCRIVIKDDKAYISLYDEAFGVACGQYGVIYIDDMIVGSGEIVGVDGL